MIARISTLSIVLITALATPRTVSADPWPQWRGPNRDGKSLETGLLKSWPESGPELKWREDNLGEGYSTPTVANGLIYGTGYQDDDEVAWALNQADGSVAWQVRIAEAERDVGYGHGPRSSPTVAGRFVYTLGAGGDLTCMDSETGAILWQRHFINDFKGYIMSRWGFSESVLIDGERLICTPGGKPGTVVCLNRRNGNLVWRTREIKEEAAYTSVIKETIEGVEQYLVLTGESVFGIEPSTGELLWRAKRPGKTAVISTPIYHENQVFVTSAYNVGCDLFEITRSGNRFKAKRRYRNKDIKNHHGGAIRVGEHIYASSGPILVCMEMKTGEVAWEERSVGKGALTYADGHLYLRSEQGPIALIEANPKAYVEKGRFKQPDRTRRQSWAHPVISDGTLYLRDQDLLFAYDVKE